jgi:MFS family permease
LLMAAMCVLCGAMINVAEPLLAIGPLHAGRSGFAVLITLYGVGMVAGTAYAARLGASISLLRAHFLAGIVASGIAMLACASSGGLVSALAPFAFAGFGNALMANPELRLLQELVHSDYRGRLFGFRDSIQCACFAIAFVVAGGLVSAIGPRGVYAVSGALLLGVAVAGRSRLKSVVRTPTPSDGVPASVLAGAELT